MNKDFLIKQGYASTFKAALICLLLGSGFLAISRFLVSGASGVARIAEFLGWGSLATSTAVLFSAWREATAGQAPWPPWGRARPSDESISREEAIDQLYTELRPLMSRAAVDPGLRTEVQAKLARLRQLQTEEADEMVKRFDAGLLLKPGEGWQALERARELLARYEDPASSDTPTARNS
jgi:hypothetical protein